MSTQQTSFKNESGVTVTPISGANTSDTNPKQGYEQTLTQLKFSDDSTSMASGNSGTLVLPADAVIVNLLVSQPSALFPVLATSVGPDYTAAGGWPKPFTSVDVKSSQITAMKQALTFRQNIMAAPSSSLASAFQTALQQAQQAKTADDMISQMNAFFQSQASYSQVTYPDYAAIQSYLQTFAQMWVQKNAATKGSSTGATYYVYSAPDAGKTGANSEGTIQASRRGDAPANASLTDPLSGYSIVLTSSGGGDPVTLSFQNGAFTDGGPVQLSATYSYAGRFNGKVSDVQLWPILVGTIQSKQVIAIPLSPESGWDKFWSSLTFGKLFSYFMEAMGLWMALDFLKTKLSSKKEALEKDKADNKGEEPSDKQVADAETQADTTALNDAQANSSQGQQISGDDSFDVPTSDSAINDAVGSTRTASQDALNNIAEDNANGAIEQTGSTLEEIAEIEVTPALEKAGSQLNEAGEAMQETPPDISSATENIKAANANLSTATEELGTQISAEQKAALEEQIKANEEAADDAKEQDEESEDAGKGDDPEGEGDLPDFLEA